MTLPHAYMFTYVPTNRRKHHTYRVLYLYRFTYTIIILTAFSCYGSRPERLLGLRHVTRLDTIYVNNDPDI